MGYGLARCLVAVVVQKNRLYSVLLPKLHNNDKYFYNIYFDRGSCASPSRCYISFLPDRNIVAQKPF